MPEPQLCQVTTYVLRSNLGHFTATVSFSYDGDWSITVKNSPETIDFPYGALYLRFSQLSELTDFLESIANPNTYTNTAYQTNPLQTPKE